jgi:hypothetical protein
MAAGGFTAAGGGREAALGSFQPEDAHVLWPDLDFEDCCGAGGRGRDGRCGQDFVEREPRGPRFEKDKVNAGLRVLRFMAVAKGLSNTSPAIRSTSTRDLLPRHGRGRNTPRLQSLRQNPDGWRCPIRP